MQFQVPQNIDLEDKIVGPLTLIQFLYLLAGGIVVYLLFLSVGTGFLFWLVGLPIAIVALALAFLKIQEQPLPYFIKAGLVFLSRPKTRLWQRHGLVLPVVQAPQKKIAKAESAPKKMPEKSELEKLAQALDVQTKPPIKHEGILNKKVF